MKRISYRIANFILIAALLLSGAVTAHAASTTEASEKVQLRSDCTLDVTYSSEGMVFAGQDIKLCTLRILPRMRSMLWPGASGHTPSRSPAPPLRASGMK